MLLSLGSYDECCYKHLDASFWVDMYLTSLGQTPRNRIAGSHGDSMFSHLRNCQTVFCTILHNHQNCMRVSASLHPCPHQSLSDFFHCNHSGGCEVGFDKNIPEERLTLTKILVLSAFFLNVNYGIQLTYGKHSPERREPIQRSNINSFEIIFGLPLNPLFFFFSCLSLCRKE